jgi:hypothetical protein
MPGPEHEHSNRQDVSTIRDASKEFFCVIKLQDCLNSLAMLSINCDVDFSAIINHFQRKGLGTYLLNKISVVLSIRHSTHLSRGPRGHGAPTSLSGEIDKLK